MDNLSCFFIDNLFIDKCGLSQVLKIVEEEENELQAQLLEYEHCPEYCFVVNAINLLKQRKNFLLEVSKK